MKRRYRSVIDEEREKQRYLMIQEKADQLRNRTGELFRQLRNLGSEIDALFLELKNANIGLPVLRAKTKRNSMGFPVR